MTDRVRGFVVTLSKNLRADDAEALVNAIKCLAGVVGVKPVINEVSDDITEMRVRQEYLRRLYEVFGQ